MDGENKTTKPRAPRKKAADASWRDGLSVYVNSAGYGQIHDYRWRELSGDTMRPPAAGKADLDRLVEIAGSQTIASLCIERTGGKLRLIICNLPGVRPDFMGRPIANAIALFGDDTGATERALRRIAAGMLRDTAVFAEAVDLAIARDESAETTGWKIVAKQLDKVLGGFASGPADEAVSDAREYNAAFSDPAKDRLGKELAGYLLPMREGILVLVAPHHAPSLLTEMRVWRGISAHPSVMGNGKGPAAAVQTTLHASDTSLVVRDPIIPVDTKPNADDLSRATAIQDAVVAAGIASAFLIMISAIVWTSRPRW